MKFAILNGVKTEPQPGLKGVCPNCESEALAKCGQVKIWHWAHKSKISCDPWWENETEWHRAWKNRFPVEWQENIHTDPATGEKHIADVKTADGLVIEFQHSAIDPVEMTSRVNFYKKMVWVVDGTRLKRDYPRFCKGLKDCRNSIQQGVFLSNFPDECFPANWLNSSVPIYFDFQGNQPTETPGQKPLPLWCLFPRRLDNGTAVIAAVSREQFVMLATTTPHLLFAEEIINNIAEYLRLMRYKATMPLTNTNYPPNRVLRRRRRF